MSNQPATTDTKEQLAKTVSLRDRRNNAGTEDGSIAQAAIIPIGDATESPEPAAPDASTPAAHPTLKGDPATGTALQSTVRITPVQQTRTEFRDLRTTGTLRIRAPRDAEATLPETVPEISLHPSDRSRSEENVEPVAKSSANDYEALALGETIVRAVPLAVLLGGSNPPQRSESVTKPHARATTPADRSSPDTPLSAKTLVMPIRASTIADALDPNGMKTTATQTTATQTTATQTAAAQTELARKGATLGRIGTGVPWGAETLVKPVAAPTMTRVLEHMNAPAKVTPVAATASVTTAAGATSPLRAETIVNPVASPIAASPATKEEPGSTAVGHEGTEPAMPLGKEEKAKGSTPKVGASGIRKVVAALVVVAVGVTGAYVAMPSPAPHRGTTPRAVNSSSASTAQNTDGEPTELAHPTQSKPHTAATESGNKPLPVTVGGKTLERQAVDAIARGAYAEAANLYERMDQDPEAPFHEAARIARRKAQSER